MTLLSIKILNRFQYNSALAITGAVRGISREKLYQKLSFESLQQKRWYRKLCCLFKIIINQSPRYLFQVVPSPNTRYFFQISENIPQLWTKHDFFKNSFFPSTIKEWNNLDPQSRKTKSISIFKSNVLKFIRFKPNNVYYCRNPKGIKIVTSYIWAWDIFVNICLRITFKAASILFPSAVTKSKLQPTTYSTALSTQMK